jgi:hypothetical protein
MNSRTQKGAWDDTWGSKSEDHANWPPTLDRNLRLGPLDAGFAFDSS